MSLADLGMGESGRVVSVDGARGFSGRLQVLGIHPGAVVKRRSSVFGRGPVIVEVGGSRVALGFGRARRVIVEVDGD